MEVAVDTQNRDRYESCIKASRSVRWDIDEDVFRGRQFDQSQKYLPDGLALLDDFDTLSAAEKLLVSQIQGRTYANVFGLVERFINAKVLELSRDYWLGDQVKLEALVRFSDEELKHQEMFRRLDAMLERQLPAGYRFAGDPDAVAQAVLSASTWGVLALTLDIELFTQLHYRESIDPDPNLSPLFKDVFLFHWKEESQHATLDELEWTRHDAALTAEQRDRGVDDFIGLVASVDGLLRGQAHEDARYLADICGRTIDGPEREVIEAAFLKAYRWQYIHSGAAHPRFVKVLSGLTTSQQLRRISDALESLR